MEHKHLRERITALKTDGIALNAASGRFDERMVAQHTHDVVEIFCVRKGRGWDHSGNQVQPLNKGTVGIIHYTQSHAFTGGPLEVINLFLDLSRWDLPDVGDLRPALHAILPVHPSLRYRERPAIHLRPPNHDHLDVLVAMLAEYQKGEPGALAVIQGLLQAFLAQLAREAHRSGLSIPTRANDTVPAAIERVRRHLHQHFRERLGLRAMANMAGCAEATLARSFRHYTGESIVGYTHKLRIKEACRNLIATDDQIIDILRSVGFQDQAFFNRIFLRRTGLTPRRYRQRGHAIPC